MRTTQKSFYLVVILIVLLITLGGAWWQFGGALSEAPAPACTEEAKICPDGTVVVRQGSNCEFAACPPEPTSAPTIPPAIQAEIDRLADRIVVSQPGPLSQVDTPLTVAGEARGSWFFEGDFPVIVTDWDGRIIGEGYATAEGSWMTDSFVPFAGTIQYALPEDAYSATGTIIFQRANPSGLPEHDAALEFPIRLR